MNARAASAHPPIGKLRHRVGLEQPVDVDDGSGGTTRSWQSVATLWARIEPLNVSERVEADRIEAAASHRITIRYRADVTHDMRFVSGTRVFAIHGLTDIDERHRFLICHCEEVAP